VAELQEEVTQVQAIAVMAGAHAAEVEGMAQEKAAVLATAHDEVAGATQRVSILGYELATTHQAKNAAEDKISSLVAEVATTKQR
jgi:hypothetical protein